MLSRCSVLAILPLIFSAQAWWQDGLVHELYGLARAGERGAVNLETQPRREWLERLTVLRAALPAGSGRLGDLLAPSGAADPDGALAFWLSPLPSSCLEDAESAGLLDWSLVHYLLHRGAPGALERLADAPPPARLADLRAIAVDPTLHARGLLREAPPGELPSVLVAPAGLPLSALTADWDAYWRAILGE